MRTGLLALAAFVLATANAQAAFLVQYNFAGQPGYQPSTPVTTVTDPLISATDITRGPGIDPIPIPPPGDTSNNNSMASIGWSTTGFEGSDYYTFTISVAPGYTFSLFGLQYADQRNTDGPRSVVVRADNESTPFTTDLDVSGVGEPYTTSGGTENRELSFVGNADFTGLQSITFRIYAYGSLDEEEGIYRLRNYDPNSTDLPSGLLVRGEITPAVNPVPAPASFGLLALGAPALLLVRRRRSAK